MIARFRVDLLHPGALGESWPAWFTGPRGGRRLLASAAGAALALSVVLVAGLLPAQWRLSADPAAVPALRRDLTRRDLELGLLRSNLRGLSQEARRQVRWADLLTTLGQETPSSLRLQLVEVARVAPAPPAAPAAPAAAAAARGEETLRIEALTPLRPGSPPLLDVAQFIGSLMRDPALGRRFELRSWEIKPSPITAGGEPLLGVSIVMAERPQ